MSDVSSVEESMEGFTNREVEVIRDALSELSPVLLRNNLQGMFDCEDNSYTDEDRAAFKHVLDLIGEY